MLGEPKQRPDEAMGDFLRRRCRFFLKLSLASGFLAIMALAVTWLTWPSLELKIFFLGVLSLILLAAWFSALVGALSSSLQSLSHPRLPSPRVDRALYIMAIALALAFGASFAYLAIDGFITGEVVAGKWGKISNKDSLLVYWLLEIFWGWGCIITFREALRYRHKMGNDKLLSQSLASR